MAGDFQVLEKKTRFHDYDRGVLIRVDPTTGVEVFMYCDEPGVYTNAKGGRIPDDIAKRAGYDTDQLGRMRLAKEKLAEYEKTLRESLELDTGRKVLKEWEGFKVIEVGADKAQVQAPDGTVLSHGSIPTEDALSLLAGLSSTLGTVEDKAA